jgi:hypothetical protein
MGGMGSGSWYRYANKKCTVEECLSLNVFRLHQQNLLCPGPGSLTWNRVSTGENRGSVGYSIQAEKGNHLVMTLHFTRTIREAKEVVQEPILLIPTRPHFGGIRYWFQCPLVISGRPCGRKSGKLHLPPGQKFFGFRHCYGLTYASRQEHNKRMDVFARAFKRGEWF